MIPPMAVVEHHRKSLNTTQFLTEVTTEMDIVMVRRRKTRMITIILKDGDGVIQMNPTVF